MCSCKFCFCRDHDFVMKRSVILVRLYDVSPLSTDTRCKKVNIGYKCRAMS